MMMQIALRYQRNNEDAQALVNQGFLKVFNALSSGKYSSDIPFEYWMRRVMINCMIDEYRKVKKHLEHTENVEDIQQVNHISSVSINEGEANLDADELREMVKTLPEIGQKVFNLCVLDGYEYAEVAEMLDISESTIRWHIHNSRNKLKTLINERVRANKKIAL